MLWTKISPSPQNLNITCLNCQFLTKSREKIQVSNKILHPVNACHLVTCLLVVGITGNPDLGSRLYPTNMVGLPTNSVWSHQSGAFFLSGFIFLLRNIRPVSVSFDDCTVLCLPIGPNIRYANVSCSLCFIFYLCFLVSNMFGFARSFDLVVRKFMRRHQGSATLFGDPA